MSTSRRRYLDVLLGLFVAVGIALVVVFIFAIGKERRLFDTSAHVEARYPNVSGLAIGAQVLLGGVVIGHVSEIKLPPILPGLDKGPQEVTVIMRVSYDMLPWMREDSIARIDGKGLLGDKIINISLGTAQYPQIKDGGILKAVAPLDLNEALEKAELVLGDITDTIAGAKRFIEGFFEEGGDKALAEVSASIKSVAREIERGDGLIHQLVYDAQSGQDYKKLMSELSKGAGAFQEAASDFDHLLKTVRTGKGLLNAIIYDPEAAKAIDALKDLGKIAQEGQLVDNLNHASSDLRVMLERIKEGQGTLGRLIVDPSVYDDLKALLGKVKRNEVLKALLRFTISRKEREQRDK